MKKAIVSLLTFMLLIVGILFCGIDAKEVEAAAGDVTTGEGYVAVEYTDLTVYRTTNKNVAPTYTSGTTEWIFAGWYQEAECKNAFTDVKANTTLAYAKFVPADVLSVKLQLKADTLPSSDKTNMRLVSSVDTLNYSKVGYEIYFNGAEKPVRVDTSTVYERIVASATSGVDYNYSPKVVDVESKYFVTATLVNISNGNFKNNFYIKPYWETLDGTTVYGVNRYVNVNNGLSDSNVNIPVKGKFNSPSVTFAGINYTIADSYYDGTYTHFNVTIPSRNTALKSVSKVAVSDGITTVNTYWRNLLTSFATHGADTSWYNVYNTAEVSQFVIATDADFHGLSEVAKTYNFSGKFVNLVADITLNEGDASNWRTSGPAVNWTPIGRSDVNGSAPYFAGTFEGNEHRISGIYIKGNYYTSGLFGEVRDAKIKNVKLVNSYIENTIADQYPNVGSIAANGYGTFSNIYSNATVVGYGYASGGILGRTSCASSTFSSCWFDGEVQAKGSNGRYSGGIVGYASGAPCVMENCLVSGKISAEMTGNAILGGLTGAFKQNVTLTNCLVTGSVIPGDYNLYSGAIIGHREGGTLTSTNVYAKSESYLLNSSFHVGNVSPTGITALAEPKLLGTVARTNIGDVFNWNSIWTSTIEGTPVLQSLSDMSSKSIVDATWGEDGVYVIYDMADMFAFAEMAKTTNFSGKTVKLAKDITLNTGDASTWEITAPAKKWEPLGGLDGSGQPKFAGTFDGQGHTLSGFYVKEQSYTVGLFAEIAGAKIQNVKLTNSYIEGTITDNYPNVGSIASSGYGTFTNVYSDAAVVGYGYANGGLLGRTTGQQSTFTNCWFAGNVHGKGNNGRYSGGIVGYASGAPCVIEYCLVTGTLTSEMTGNSIMGGFIGAKRQNITLTNSLMAGTVIPGAYNIYSGAIIGHNEGGTLTISNLYAMQESYLLNGTSHVGNISAASINSLSKADLTGILGDANTGLDFYVKGENETGYWLAVEGGTPILKTFATVKGIDLSKYSVDWYNSTLKNYTLNNIADLRGFAELAKKYNFSEKTIKLGSDITLNEGDVKTWGTTAPSEKWEPIGGLDGSGQPKFAGTFDGQGHTLSGFYVKEQSYTVGLFAEIAGAKIQNVKLTNSYIEGTITDNYPNVGSIASSGYGTFTNVYSDAIVVGYGYANGGLLGRTTGQQSTFSNCCFAGKVQGKGNNGRYSGGIVGYASGAPCVLEYCLVTGTLTSEMTGNSIMGGFIGAKRQNITLTNSLMAGTVIPGAYNVYSGTIIGHNEGGSLTVSNLYAMQESYLLNGTTHVGNISAASINSLAKKDITGILGDANTGLDFYVAGENEDGYWLAVEGGTPVLKTFATVKGIDLSKYSVDWYNGTLSTYTISNVADYRGFVELAEVYNFSGKTIELAADIELNTGTSNTWGTKAPANVYEPIGYTSANTSYPKFAGTFDGQGHSLSGLYIKSNVYGSGWFGELAGATIQNIRLENSYIENTVADKYPGVGGIAGNGYGTFTSVYSDAIVVAYGWANGGFLGRSTGQPSTFTDCCFAGEVIGKGNEGRYSGGIVGYASGANCTITNCLVSGDIKAEMTGNAIIGGFVGAAANSKTVTLTDCLMTGEVIPKAYNLYAGSIAGYKESGTITSNNVYTMKESYLIDEAHHVGNIAVAGITVLSKAELLDYKGYENTELDFYEAGVNDDGYWVAIKNATPQLKSFANTANYADISNAKKADTSWYTGNASSYTLNSTKEFLGFMELAKTNSFANTTIYLNADIVLNEGKASTWATKAPEYVYEPIGWRNGAGFTSNAKFAGTLNGQGHSISGFYTKTDVGGVGLFGQVAGGTIMNLKLLNSYLESNQATADDWGVIGSFAGFAYGNFETLYSEAIIVSHSQYAGGLLGKLGGTTSVYNCWFDGSVSLKGNATRGGGLVGEVSDGSTCSIQYCLNTAPISAEFATSGSAVALGGLVGRNKTTLDIKNSLSVGVVTTVSGTICGGSILGQNSGTDDAFTASTTYATYESCASLGGYTKTDANAITQLHKNDMLGEDAKDKAVALNYTIYWECAYNSTPILQSFGANKAIEQIAGTAVTADSRGDGNYMVTVADDTDMATYNSYTSALTSNGYSLHIDNSAATEFASYVKTATYTKDGMAMTVTHMTKTGVTYLTACKDLALSKHLKYDSSYIAGNIEGKKTTLANLAMYTDAGTSMVIQLKNGHFIVIDGGVQASKDSNYLLQYLKNFSSTPIVDAWIFTHFHNDHAGIMRDFAWQEASVDGIYVEGIYYNEPNADVFAMETGSNAPLMMKKYTETAASMFTTTDGGHPETYRLQTGQRYYFNDITMDVVFAQDQLPKSQYNGLDGANFNDSSTWVTFTIEGSKVLCTGDADRGSMDWVIENYAGGYLKNLAMLALPHHSWNPYQAFTDAVEVTSVIVNAGTWGSSASGDKYLPNDKLKEKADEWLTWAGTGGIIYSFPSGGYTVGNYSEIPKTDMP